MSADYHRRQLLKQASPPASRRRKYTIAHFLRRSRPYEEVRPVDDHPGCAAAIGHHTGGRDRCRHGAVPVGGAFGVLGRLVSRQQRERRQAETRTHAQRERLIAPGAVRSDLGRQPHQEHLSGGSIRAAGGAAGCQTGDPGGGPQHPNHRVPHAQEPVRVPGVGRRLFRPAARRWSQALLRETATTTRADGRSQGARSRGFCTLGGQFSGELSTFPHFNNIPCQRGGHRDSRLATLAARIQDASL